MAEVKLANVRMATFESQIKTHKNDLKEMKHKEILRVVKDCINENSYINRN